MSLGRHAKATEVAADRSRGQIESLLRDYGAKGYASVWDDDARRHLLEFKIEGTAGVVRQVRLVVPYPDPEDREIARTPTGKPRPKAAQVRALEQADRQRWRQVRLLIQAKLEAIETGISTLEREFLADVVVPELDQTIAQQLEPQLAGRGLLQLGQGS